MFIRNVSSVFGINFTFLAFSSWFFGFCFNVLSVLIDHLFPTYIIYLVLILNTEIVVTLSLELCGDWG